MILPVPSNLWLKKECLRQTVMGGVRYTISPGRAFQPRSRYSALPSVQTGNPWRVALQTRLPTPVTTKITLVIVKATLVIQRSAEHTSELQSRENLVCRLLLEKNKRTR